MEVNEIEDLVDHPKNTEDLIHTGPTTDYNVVYTPSPGEYITVHIPEYGVSDHVEPESLCCTTVTSDDREWRPVPITTTLDWKDRSDIYVRLCNRCKDRIDEWWVEWRRAQDMKKHRDDVI